MQELQLNREMEQEHGKESILLVHNEDFQNTILSVSVEWTVQNLYPLFLP